MKNPYAHLHLPDISLKMVEESIMLWDPLHYLEACPSSDGAAAMIIGSERAADQAASDTGRRPAWIHGMAMRSEPTMFAGRDQVNPQAGRDCAADVYRQAGISDPRADFDMAEVYVPFSWYEPMWLENLGFCAEGDGWKLTEAGHLAHRRRGHPLELFGGRPLFEPDRRLRHAAFFGDGPPDQGTGGGASSARRPSRARPGLRRGLPILRHVGARSGQALIPRGGPVCSSLPNSQPMSPAANQSGGHP
jgi:hypothetical protein